MINKIISLLSVTFLSISIVTIAQNYDWSWITNVYEDPCPSVYVYDTGPQYYGIDGFNYHDYVTKGIESPYGVNCENSTVIYRTHQYELLRIVLYRLRNSKRCLLVKDPKKAKLFLVPMYPGGMNLTGWVHSCKSNQENPIPHLPYLTKKTAPFHFFIVAKSPTAGCKDWFRFPKNDSLLKEAVRLAYGTTYIVTNRSVGAIGVGPYEKTTEIKNLIEDHNFIPNALSVPYPSCIHWSTSFFKHRKAPWQSEGYRRRYLVSFTGKFRDCPFGHIRPYLEKAFKNCSENICKAVHTFECNFIRAKLRSTFCLEPGGDGPWRKSLYDSITSGCIPVIFNSYNRLVSPWHWGPFAQNASVYIDENKIMNGEIDLIQYLQAIPKKQIKIMQQTLAKYGHMIQYALDDYPNDGVEIILKGVYRYGMMRLNQK